MTDYYIWEVVVKPAVRKSLEMERKYGKRTGVGRSRGRFKIPTKKQYREVGTKLNIPPEVCDREYEKFKAERRNGHHD